MKTNSKDFISVWGLNSCGTLWREQVCRYQEDGVLLIANAILRMNLDNGNCQLIHAVLNSLEEKII